MDSMSAHHCVTHALAGVSSMEMYTKIDSLPLSIYLSFPVEPWNL